MTLPVMDIAPGTTAYNMVLIPFGFLMMLALAATLALRQTQNSYRLIGIPASCLMGLAVGHYVIQQIKLDAGPAVVAVAAVASALVLASIIVILVSAAGLARRRGRAGAHLAHIGVAALMIGSILSGYTARESEALLLPGQSGWLLGHKIGLVEVSAPTKDMLRSKLTIDNHYGAVEMEQNSAFNVLLRRAWILRGFHKDLYITPMDMSLEQGGMLVLKASSKPGMWLVWIGICLIAAGIAVSLIHRPSQHAHGVLQ
jgi:cytochrome c biogenesis factor